MSVSINAFTSLDSISWKPVDFEPVGNKLAVKKTPVIFNNGMRFYLHDMLKDAPDFSFNRKTGLLLTAPAFNSLIFDNNDSHDNVSSLKRIESPIMDVNKNIFTLYPTNSSSINPKYTIANSGGTVFTSADTFTFIFSNEQVSILNTQGDYLTVSKNNQLIFSPQLYINNDSQLFDYFLGKNSISLFESGTNYGTIVDHSNETISLTAVKLSTIPDTSIFTFTSFESNTLEDNRSVYDSFVTKYITNPTKNQSLLEVDYNFSNENLLVQNFIGIFPIEYYMINDFDVKYPIQIHGLKNYQTPEYNYTVSNPLFNYSSSIRRIYNKILTGTNQNKGYDRVYLAFQADTKELIFDVNKETPFYFPSTSESTLLSLAGFIEDGAIASSYPYTSDRISLYRENYQEKTQGVSQPNTIPKQDNTWFISWLSGSNTGDKKWVDRYYNAAYYTLDQTLTAKSIVYNEKIDTTLPFTYDVPSTMVLEPGILYKYFRAGQINSQNFLTYLDSDVTNPLGSKILSITQWLSSPIVDDSSYHNNGLVFFSSPSSFQKDYFIMDGTNHVVFPSRQSLLQNNNLTVSIWLNVKDWGNIYGDQIFGNYYDSGFGLINEGSLTAPIFTFTNTASSIAYNINYNFTKLSEVIIPSNINSNFNLIIRLSDYSFWVFDSNNLTGYKYNPLNNIVGSLSAFSLSSYINELDQVETDQYENLYFYDNNKKAYVKTDPLGNFKSFVSLGVNSGINRIELDITNTVIPIYGTSSVIDNENNIWEVVGGNLYKNRQIFACIGFTQQLLCDSQNNIWISHNQDTISKLNTSEGLFEFSNRIGKYTSLALDPCRSQDRFRYMGFVKVPVDSNTTPCDRSLVYDDRLIIIDARDNETYILDSSGNLLSKLDLRAILSNPQTPLSFIANGDFTGYSYLRKYGGTTKNLSWKFKIAEPNGNNSQLLTLQYSASGLPTGWHNFALSFDALNGSANYYIDSILVDQTTFSPRKYQLYYDFRSSLLLGAATVRNTSLNDIIGIDNGFKFIGNVADIRMYSKSLTQGELEQVYFSSPFAIPREALNWNMNVGNRTYIEEIEHWYKMQLPGSKSKYFNINIHNLKIDDSVKKIVEDAVKSSVAKITPAEATLYKINWM
jgi:hypothetical protein